MKHTMIKIAVAAGIGMLAGTSAGYADLGGPSTMAAPSYQGNPSIIVKAENGTSRVAKKTWHGAGKVASRSYRESKGFASSAWDESKRIGRTVIDSPVIAYQVIRGERPLFTREGEYTHEGQSRQGVALTGHRAANRADRQAVNHAEPPPI